jgi:hypothetical protein
VRRCYPGAGPRFKSTLSVKARSIAAAERQRKVFGFSINALVGTHPGIRGCRREKCSESDAKKIYFCFDRWYFHASILCDVCRLNDNRSNDI